MRELRNAGAVAGALAALTLALAGPATAQAPSPPNAAAAVAVVRAFYDWYLKQPQGGPIETSLEPVRKDFDPSLYAALTNTCASDPLDWDPFVSGQGGWEGYTLGQPAIRGESVLVPIRIAVFHSTQVAHLTAVVQRGAAGSYAIDDFIYDDQNKVTARTVLACPTPRNNRS